MLLPPYPAEADLSEKPSARPAAPRAAEEGGYPMGAGRCGTQVCSEGRCSRSICSQPSSRRWRRPRPTLRLREGEDAVINVTNRLGENASIHWHGLIVPPEMDGVPGISPGYGDGIRPGETFTYRFKVKQAGTYWFHSHSSGAQEQL